MRSDVLLDDIQDAANKLEALRNRYLREHGWEYTCQTPGRYWMWKKVVDGILLHCSESHAMDVEEYLADREAALAPQSSGDRSE
jgi:hypothetical protein